MAKRRRKKPGEGLRQPDRIEVSIAPFTDSLRERAAIEGVTPHQWIRDAIADRLGVERVMRIVGNPTFGRKPKPEIVDNPPVDPLDSSINSLWE